MDRATKKNSFFAASLNNIKKNTFSPTMFRLFIPFILLAGLKKSGLPYLLAEVYLAKL